jgi:hypothetical protein
MSLIWSGRITVLSDRQMSESEWTKLLLERGYAQWAESELRWRAASKQEPTPAVSQAQDETPAEGLSARTHEKEVPPVSQARHVSTERRRALREMADRFSRRSRDREELAPTKRRYRRKP